MGDAIHLRPSAGPCALCSLPTEGLGCHLVDLMRERHGKGGVNVCRPCVERAKQDAETTRDQLVTEMRACTAPHLGCLCSCRMACLAPVDVEVLLQFGGAPEEALLTLGPDNLDRIRAFFDEHQALGHAPELVALADLDNLAPVTPGAAA